MSISVSHVKLRQFLSFCAEISWQKEAYNIALNVINNISPVLDCERASFFFVRDDSLELILGQGVDSIKLPLGQGLVGECAATKKVISVPFAYKDSRFNKEFDKKIPNWTTKNILVAPVCDKGGKVIGVLQALNHKGGAFDVTHETMISYLANHVGACLSALLSNQQMKLQLAKRTAFMDCLMYFESCDSFGASTIIFSLRRAAQAITNCDRVTIYTVNHETKTIKVVDANSSTDFMIPIGQGIAGMVAKTGEAEIIPDAYADKRFNGQLDKETGYKTKTMLVIPMIDVNQTVNGVMQMINKSIDVDDGEFTAEDQRFMVLLAKTAFPMLLKSGVFYKKHIIDSLAHISK